MLLGSLELDTNDPEGVLRLSGVERFSDGSGYKCRLEVRSRGFQCDRDFYFDRSSLGQCVESLDQMVAGAVTSATLKGQFEDDCVRLRQNELGHVWVEGEIFDHPCQHLRFAFRTDQTVLPRLVKGLRAWLRAS